MKRFDEWKCLALMLSKILAMTDILLYRKKEKNLPKMVQAQFPSGYQFIVTFPTLK